MSMETVLPARTVTSDVLTAPFPILGAVVGNLTSQCEMLLQIRIQMGLVNTDVGQNV